MSLSGLKKQLNKANQFVTEKIGGAEGTKLDEEYLQCEKKIDIMSKLIEDIINRTHEYLQPNPASRAKLVTVNTLNKMQGKNKCAAYPQPEGQLGECMIKYGNELGIESLFAECLVEAGKSFKGMEEIKYNMEDQVKSTYIEPLRGIQTVELKEINFHRKKLEGRRLDYDCKKRRRENAASTGKVIEDEVNVAELKFQETKAVAEKSMYSFLSSDLEHISALAEFVDTQAVYYRQAAEIMEALHKTLVDKKDEASTRTRPEYIPKPVNITRTLSREAICAQKELESSTFASKNNTSTAHGPCCRALYQFDAENDTELAFCEGDVIELINQVDENWFEGRVNNKVGFFPVNYVDVIVPLHST